MATRTVRFDDFSGGEFGDLGPLGASRTMFSGTNIMRYNDGTLGPRPGVKALSVSGASAGIVWALQGLGVQAANAQVYGQGSNLYGFTFSPLGSIVAVGTVSTTATTASQIIQYGPGTGELARPGDKVYEVVSGTPVVTPLPGSPGAETLAAYGVRLMAANGAVNTATATATSITSKRVYYSGAADLTSWPALNYFDVGNVAWEVAYIDEIRQRLVLANHGGEWWALTGTPGVNDSLKRQPRGDLAPGEWYHAARLGESIWFFPIGEDFPVQFTGIVVDKLRFRHLRFTSGGGSDWRLVALPVAEMVLGLEDGGQNRGMLFANDVWSYLDFGVTTSRFATVPSVGGPGADLDMPVIFTDGGSAGAAPNFYTFAPSLDRPGKTGDTYAQPGDDSTTPLSASIYTPAIMAKDGHEIWGARVTVDGFKWDTGSSSTNHFDCQIRSYFRRNLSGTKDLVTPLVFDEAASATTSDKTPFSWTKRGGAQQPGAAIQVRLDNLRGVAAKVIEVEVDERPIQ